MAFLLAFESRASLARKIERSPGAVITT